MEDSNNFTYCSVTETSRNPRISSQNTIDFMAIMKIWMEVSSLAATYTGLREGSERLKEEALASPTTEYNTWKKAVGVFMSDMNVYFKGEENNTKLEEWFP